MRATTPSSLKPPSSTKGSAAAAVAAACTAPQALAAPLPPPVPLPPIEGPRLMDIRQILTDNAIRDMLNEEDERFLNTIRGAL